MDEFELYKNLERLTEITGKIENIDEDVTFEYLEELKKEAIEIEKKLKKFQKEYPKTKK